MSRAIIGPIIALAYVGSLNFTMSSVLRLVDHGVCGWVGGCVGGGGVGWRKAAMKGMQMKS